MKLVSFLDIDGDETFVNPERASGINMLPHDKMDLCQIHIGTKHVTVQGRAHEVAHRLADEVVFPPEVGAPPMHEPFTCPECGCHQFHSMFSAASGQRGYWTVLCQDSSLDSSPRCTWVGGPYEAYVTTAPVGEGEGA